MSEALLITLVCSFIILPIGITLILGGRYPLRTKLGIGLSFLFGPWGQLYLIEGAWKFTIFLLIFYAFGFLFLRHNAIIILWGNFLSAFIMHFRLSTFPMAKRRELEERELMRRRSKR